MHGEVCGRSVRGTGILFELSHSAHRSWLVLQASEPGTSDEMLPADDRIHDLYSATQSAIQAPNLHGPGCWRKLLLRCFECRNPSVSS